MLYCDDCADQNDYPITMAKSVGQCEVCNSHCVCNEMSSMALSDREQRRKKHGEKFN